MNPRHVAALALMGWYLMIPPLSPYGPFADASAPLSKWNVYAAYDEAQQCNEAYVEYNHLMERKKATHPSDKNAGSLATQLLDAQCIASDDPRLAK